MRRLKAHIRASTVFAAFTFLGVATVLPTDAQAFEIFGMKFFEGEEETPVSDPVAYSLKFSAGADDDLTGTLQEASALYTDQKNPVSGDLGLVIKARDDRERLLAALYEQARYGAVVTVEVAGTEIDQLPAVPMFPHDRPVPVTVTVDPGPVFTVKTVNLTGDAAKFNPDDYGLAPGSEARSNVVVLAAGKMVEDLEAEGRPLAKLTQRELIANHDDNTVTLTIGAEGGPVADIGDVKIVGSKTVKEDFIRDWSRLNKGQRYSPQDVKDASERLRKLGVFSSINITKSDRLDKTGKLPMAIQLSDGKQRYFGGGVQFSSIDGLGVQGYWGHRNLFGGAESIKISGSVSRIGGSFDYRELDYNFSVLFSKPAAFSQITTFNTGVIASQVQPDSYRAKTLSAFANVAFDLSRIDTVTGGFDVTWNETEDVFGTGQYLIASTPVSWLRDASDEPLDPTTGYKFNLKAQPSYEINDGLPFSSFEGSVSGYYPFGQEDDVVFAGKFSMGTLLGVGDISEIPAVRRFYAGGGGSVRGFGYQEISPRNDDGDALGGRSYMLTSFEARVKVTDKFGVVPFLDVGTVGRQLYPDFSDLRAGLGIGIRYATPFGPIRLDFAVPLNRYDDGSRFGIYAGIGQSF
ncbi:MAG: putative outer membrane protein protective antigen [Rhizobium sp.]|nr:putative outer membrane protein protective antigen [Rhizobium sp.]